MAHLTFWPMHFLSVRTITSRPLHSSNTLSATGESTRRHSKVSMTEHARGERHEAKLASVVLTPGRTVASGSSGLAEAWRSAVSRSRRVYV
jgi:hypothetical protein